MPILPSKIAFGLGTAGLAAYGTAVTVNPRFSPQATGKIDRMPAAPESAPPPVGQDQERAAAAPALPGRSGAGSEPAAAGPPSVSTERTTTQTGKKQIRVYNPGGTVILEFGHERR